MKEAVFDIETSDLSAVGPGVLLCAVFKPSDGKALVLRYDEFHCRPGHEKKLVQAVIDEMSKYDLVVGHNIFRFDYPFLKSRACYFGIGDLPKPLYYDTLQAFRRLGYRTRDNGFGKPCASLAFAIDFFGLVQKKTAIYPREHWRTVWETGEMRDRAMNNLVAHCIADVEMNEEIYHRLLGSDYISRIERLK